MARQTTADRQVAATPRPPRHRRLLMRLAVASAGAAMVAALFAAAPPAEAGPPGFPDVLDPLLPNPDPRFAVAELTADGRHVVHFDRASVSAPATVVATPLDGSAPVDLGAGLVGVAREAVSFVVSPAPSDDRVIVVTRSSTDTIEMHAVSIGGGAPVAVGGPSPLPRDVDEVAMAPDGDHVVFIADNDVTEERALFSAPTDGGPRVELVDPVIGGDVDSFAIDPSGSLVAFTGDVRDEGVDELFVVGIGGDPAAAPVSGPIVTGGGVDPNPVFLPDGTGIIFRGDLETAGTDELWRVVGGVRSRLSGSVVDGGDVFDFSVASDGTAVVFRGDLRVVGVQDLFVRRFADPGRIRLVQDLGRGVRNHAIAPDSSHVVFDGDLDGDDLDGVYSVPLTGGTVTQLNEDGSQALLAFGDEVPLAVFTPDGSRVVFNQFVPAPGAVTLRSVATDGGIPHVLDSEPAGGSFFTAPQVTPDGLRAVYLLLDDEELFIQVRVVDSAHRCAGRVATIIGTDGPDPLRGTPGDDVVVGLGGRDTIATGRGQDVVCAGAGNDTVRAGAGDDIVFGGRGADVGRGGPGRDRLVGQAGRDRLSAGAGNDLLRGNRGRDVLAGQRGNDRIVGGPGRDRCTGGPGRDRIRQCERG